MDSQITLVQPPSSNPDKVLYFDRPSFTDVRITDKHNQVVYDVKSDKHGYTIKIYEGEKSNESNEPCVIIQKSDIFSDKVKFRGQDPVKIKDWINGGDQISLFIFQHEGRKYVWKATGSYQVSFYAETDAENPIAWFQDPIRSVGASGKAVVVPGYLALKGEALLMIDVVLASYLVVAQKVTKNIMGRGIGEGQALSAFGVSALYHAAKC
ncbi:hypothetical protein AX16_009240 [Volvariella volvacea WC 439]|nr:hypothetical protein AX16_009240 [Volvariella volvacea WC 439]